MVDVHLDSVASCINFIAALVLAFDALTATRRTKIRRGGQKLLEGLKKEEAKSQTQMGEATPQQEQKQGSDAPAELGKVQSPDGYAIDSPAALEDWADRVMTKKARWGFALLVLGFGLDLWAKIACNPLIFSK
jgi:hypothetical protein